MQFPVDSLASRQLMQVVYRYLNGPVPLGFTIALFGCVALLWTAGTSFVDYSVASASLRRDGAVDFPKTGGRIVASNVESAPGAKEPLYKPSVVYQYRVNDHAYEGKHVRFDDFWNGELPEAQEVVDAFPVGRAVDVSYDPADPTQSALRVGLNGTDLLWAILLLPFNLFTACLWTIVGRTVYRQIVKPPAGGASISADGYATRIRLSGASPLAIGLLHSSGAAWLGGIVVILAKGFNPPLSLMCLLWAVVVAEGLRAYFVRRRRFGRRNRVLVIDESRRELSLPKMYGRKEELLIPFDRMTGLEVRTVEKADSDGLQYVRFAPSLTFTDSDGSHRRAKIVEWWNRADAYEFASWLRDRMAVP
jgi:hypothetical protein